MFDCTGCDNTYYHYIRSMLPDLLIEQQFQTPIGVVSCGLNSSNSFIKLIEQRQYDHGNSTVYSTSTHCIELITFKRRLPLFNGEAVEGTMGWIWRITKEQDGAESLRLHCTLSPSDANVELVGSDPGEHLDSALMHNQEWMLHIGTEDGEVMQSRALNEDWMPLRLKGELEFSHSFTEVQANGLITKVPELKQGEGIHFHYLAAYDKQSDVKVNTWFAVDEFKRNLENWVGVW